MGRRRRQSSSIDAPLRIVDPDDRPKLAVIGYPAEDGRNDAFAMRQI